MGGERARNRRRTDQALEERRPGIGGAEPGIGAEQAGNGRIMSQE